MILCFLLFLLAPIYSLYAYPLDDYERTGIERLYGFFGALKTESGERNITRGAQLPSKDVRLRLLGKYNELPPVDAEFTRGIRALLPPGQGTYSLALLDLTNPQFPRYAAINENHPFIPASVGKVFVALALLQTLYDSFGPNIALREKVLRESRIIADNIVYTDHHDVPFWDGDKRMVFHRPLQAGDMGSLWTYLDWMISASSNSAGSTLMKHIILMDHFKGYYPPSPQEEMQFFAQHSGAELARRITNIMHRTMRANNFDPGKLMQASLFTREGKKFIPSVGSTVQAREMLRLLHKMEQGRLIDPWSSREMKNLLYLTQKRIRYSNSYLLDEAAVYYKSGSLYSGGPPYQGRTRNILHSGVVVEAPAEAPKVHYLLMLSTNILVKDSLVLHEEIAGYIHSYMLSLHGVPLPKTTPRMPSNPFSE
jgi:hypothetical protein